LDVRSGVDTVALDIAHIGRRLVAYIIDSILLSVVNQIVGTMLGLAAARAGGSPGLIFASVVVSLGTNILYDGSMTAARGQTLGKMAMKIKVIAETGADVTSGQGWGRACAKLIPFAVLVALFNDERKGLHDMLAHTRVVNWR
ncbi:MAG TPA: RDD family protein, partial [Thermoanaerobaculia bacterium]|nr:RDD family protein [Thermoanaerobaculia bacterium]